MAIIDNVKEKVKEWLFTVALKKAVKKMAQLILSYLSAKGLTIVLNGSPLDVETLTVIILGVLEVIRNFLKIKFPKYFGWL